MNTILEQAHKAACDAAMASSRSSSGQPYDGYPPPAYEVYRDALISHILQGAEQRVAKVIDLAIETRSDTDEAAKAAIRAIMGDAKL